jgi:hypothetical protein
MAHAGHAHPRHIFSKGFRIVDMHDPRKLHGPRSQARDLLAPRHAWFKVSVPRPCRRKALLNELA